MTFIRNEREDMQEDMNKIISEILHKYCEIRNIDKLPEISVEIVEDLYSVCVQKSADVVKRDLESQKEWMQTLNGTIVYPECCTDPFGILIKKSYIEECISNNNCNWIGTLCHELTHVIDYVSAMNLTGKIQLVDFKNERYYQMFVYWTEYNARRHGHYLLRYYTHGDLLRSPMILNDLVNREMPYQIQYLVSNFEEGKSPFDAVYSTMQFLGRLKVWKGLFPDYFNETALNQVLGDNGWMEELFSYLDENDTIEKAISTFDVMENILRNYFD